MLGKCGCLLLSLTMRVEITELQRIKTCCTAAFCRRDIKPQISTKIYVLIFYSAVLRYWQRMFYPSIFVHAYTPNRLNA
jgi:hypothetical protein